MNSIPPSFNSQCKDTTFMWNKHKKEAWNMKCFTFFITSLITKKDDKEFLVIYEVGADGFEPPTLCL